MTVGLEGVVAAETRLSCVDGAAGRLIIGGYNVEELAAEWRLAEVAALLWGGEAAQVSAQLGAGRRAAAGKVPELLAVTAGASVIEGLRTGWSLLCDGDAAEHDLPAPALLAGAAPVFIAALWRAGRGAEPIAPDPALDQAGDFLAMLGLDPEPAATRALERYLITISDHGMNASTFTARVVASTRAGPVSAVVAALCALKGPLHGGAPGPVLDMLDEIGEVGEIEPWIARALDGGERLMGFGHRIYRARDPRADVLKQVVAGLRRPNSRIAFAEQVEAAALAALSERHPDRPLDTNVEFYTALALDAIGLPRELFTPAFAMGRVIGWCAHIMEQEQSGRIIRPASRYTGPLPAGAAPVKLAG